MKRGSKEARTERRVQRAEVQSGEVRLEGQVFAAVAEKRESEVGLKGQVFAAVAEADETRN